MKGTSTDRNKDISSSSSAAERNLRSRGRTRSPKRLNIQISDDEASKGNNKGKDKSKENDNDKPIYKDPAEFPPVCFNKGHDEEYLRSVRLQYVREHVARKLALKKAQAAASSNDTQLQDDTQVPDF